MSDINIEFEIAKKSFLNAVDFMEKENWEEAERELKKSLQIIPDRLSTLINLGAALLKQRKHEEAEIYIDKAIQIDNLNFDAHLNKGILLIEKNRLEAAIKELENCIKIDPNSAEATLQLGILYLKFDEYGKSLNFIDKAIQIDPINPNALFIKGNLHNKQEDYEQAIEIYDRLLKINNEHYEAHLNRGISLIKLGRPEESILNIKSALDINPNHSESYYYYGLAKFEIGQFDEALKFLELSIRLKPEFPEAYFCRGNILGMQGKLNDAIEAYSIAIQLSPSHHDSHHNLGVAQDRLGLVDQSLLSFKRAVETDKNDVHSYFGLANAFEKIGDLDKAKAAYEAAISINPNYAPAFQNLGNVFLKKRNLPDALHKYDKALELNPKLDYLKGDRLFLKLLLSDWNNIESDFSELLNFYKFNPKKLHASPFHSLAIPSPAFFQKQCAINYINDRHPFIDVFKFTAFSKSDKIKLGYFSSDLHSHPIGLLTKDIYKFHDRSKFEVYVFCLSSIYKDDIQSEIINNCDHFIVLNHIFNTVDIVNAARSYNIQIAIDLNGHTEGSRTELFEHRIAPIQISYLGYPGTSGANFMDYIIADPVAIPNESKEFYTEKIAYLPNSYFLNSYSHDESLRSSWEMPVDITKGSFIFCCLNNSYKITPRIFDVWMSILKRIPNSTLMLYSSNSTASSNLAQEAELRGIDSTRLKLVENVSRLHYFARLHSADLYLDTPIYNAGTVGCDALWAGLPLLTIAGSGMQSRMGASLLSALDLPELITSNLKEYEEMAVKLASEPSLLKDIRDRLARNRHTKPLFDTALTTRHLEQAYIQMVERWEKGLPPDHFFVDDQSESLNSTRLV